MASTTVPAMAAPARNVFQPRLKWLAVSPSRFLAALQDRPVLLVRLFQLRCRVRACQRRGYGRADEIAEFGDRNDDGKTELADLGGVDHRLQPLRRHLHTL